jgi:hypothetical protein
MDWHARARGRTKACWVSARRGAARRGRSCRKCNVLSGSRFVSFGAYEREGRDAHQIPSGPLFLTRGASMRRDSIGVFIGRSVVASE